MATEDGKHSFRNFAPDSASEAGKRVELTELKSSFCRDALQVWDDLRVGRDMPAREQMTPRAMASFLSRITLYEIARGGEDFRHRIMGDVSVQIFGADFVGSDRASLNARNAGMGDVICQLNVAVIRRRAPLALRGWLKRANADPVFHETLMLPLGAVDGPVDHILAVAAYGTSYSDAIVPDL